MSGAPQRLARGSLTLEAIEESALRIVDVEGLDALTMRRLAAELGVGVMTLYGHVRTKDELVERIAERAIAELAIPDGEDPWDEQLFAMFTDVRQVLWRHPTVLYADLYRPLSGDGALRAADAALGLLRSAGLPPAAAVRAFSFLTSYTFGAAMFRGNQAGEGRDSYEVHIRGADPQQLPQVAALSTHLLRRGGDEEFAAGLRLIIDGLVRQAGGTEHS